MKRLISALFCLALISCDDGGGGSNARVRLIQAADVNSAINLFVDGQLVTTQPYGGVSSYNEEGEATHTLQGTIGASEVFNVQSHFDSDIDYSVVAVPAANNGVDPLIFVDENKAPDVGNFKIRAIQAASSAPAVDIYVLRENVPLEGQNPTFAALQFTQSSDYDQIDRNEYVVYATAPGSKTIIATTGSNDFKNFEVWTAYVINSPTGSGVTLKLSKDRDSDP